LDSYAALEHGAGYGADCEKNAQGEKRAAGTGIHWQTEPPDGACGGLETADFPSPASESGQCRISTR
jgi:hypothetical protein